MNLNHDDEAREAAQTLSALMADRDTRSEQAEHALALLARSGGIRSHRRLQYRCPRNCLLLEVFQFPQPMGWIFRQPAYRLSPEVNAAKSNEDGRRANTTDGDRRWRGHTILPEQCVNLNLNCDHLHDVIVDKSKIMADAADRRTNEIILSSTDGTGPTPRVAWM